MGKIIKTRINDRGSDIFKEGFYNGIFIAIGTAVGKICGETIVNACKFYYYNSEKYRSLSEEEKKAADLALADNV